MLDLEGLGKRPLIRDPNMLLFYCTDAAALEAIRREGLRPAKDSRSFWTSLEAAQGACDGLILVVTALALPEAEAVSEAVANGQPRVHVRAVRPEAIGNLDPYLPPMPVVAAGGYVVRPGPSGPDVLLIFRRGAWDLPKGKRDAGESIEACALREVREEVGIRELHLGRAMGSTMHSYARDGGYHVKTTHWFLMHTPETRFTPEMREGIEAVAWVPWREAIRRISYSAFRWHMQRIEEDVRRAVL